jgi:hypothetical protein
MLSTLHLATRNQIARIQLNCSNLIHYQFRRAGNQGNAKTFAPIVQLTPITTKNNLPIVATTYVELAT